MKNAGRTVLLLLALLACAVELRAKVIAGNVLAIVDPTQFDSSRFPTDLIALERGRFDARRDLSNRVLRVPVCVLPASLAGEYQRLLKTRFGIGMFCADSCVVSNERICYAQGYREISVAAIEAQFGTNILQQAWQEVKAACAARAAAGAVERPGTHRVQSGETLTRIARLHGVSLNALIAINPRVSPHRLQINQILMLPARAGGE